MRGDYTRDSFNPAKAFTRVLMQQGRVQLDADWNEQNSIVWHYLRTLTRDLLGPHGGPEKNCGFAVVPAGDIDTLGLADGEQNRLRALLKDPGDFLIGPGNYYVDGLRAVNKEYVRYAPSRYANPARPTSSTWISGSTNFPLCRMSRSAKWLLAARIQQTAPA
jgi:hypothetical protein